MSSDQTLTLDSLSPYHARLIAVQNIASAADCASLFPDLHDCLSETSNRICDLALAKYINHRPGQLITLVATDPDHADDMIGFATCKKTQDSQSSISRTVNSIWVRPDRRRRGLGTTLLREMEEVSKPHEKVSSNCYAEGVTADEEVQDWLGRRGFEEVLPKKAGRTGEAVSTWIKK